MQLSSRPHTRSKGVPAQVAHAMAVTRRPGELVALAILLFCYFLVYSFASPDLYKAFNWVGPISLFIILSRSTYIVARSNPLTIWAPVFWFRLASAIFFGLGAIIPLFVNGQTLSFLSIIYVLDDYMTLKVNYLYCAGIFSTLLMYYVFTAARGRKISRVLEPAIKSEAKRTLLFASVFIVVGMFLRYAIVLPYTLGILTFIVPGALTNLSLIYYVGIYLIVVYAVNFNHRLWYLAAPLIFVDLIVSVGTFAKTQLLLLLIFSFFGLLSRGVTAKKVVIGSIGVLVAFFSFQPLVGYGREAIARSYGSIDGAGMQERLGLIREYAQGGHTADASGIQWGLLRLSYQNVSGFVVHQYDIGQPGSTFVDAAALFVPRAIWPQKPIITRIGNDLNHQIYGSDRSAIGPGHSSEAYWNFGWLGIFPYMTVLGLILSLFTRASMIIMASKNWLYLPVVFIGVQLGLRVDGFFVPDILGAAWIALVIGGALWMTEAMLSVGRRGDVNIRQSGSRRGGV